jgi:hypothetical protein
MKKIFLLATALALAGCAGQHTRDGMSWRDGSWYSPAHDGHGDYYTRSAHRPPEVYEVPWAWSVGFVPYGGFCPAAYRYCTSFWADPWYSAAWNPWYQPFAYVPRHRPHPVMPPSTTMSNESPFDRDPMAPSMPANSRDPGPGRDPGAGSGGRGGRMPSMRERRRSAAESGRD